MENSALYRANAVECERMARKSTLIADQFSFRQMAADWQIRADAADALERWALRATGTVV